MRRKDYLGHLDKLQRGSVIGHCLTPKLILKNRTMYFVSVINDIHSIVVIV